MIDKKIEKHESFGLLSFSRASSSHGKSLFGSSLKHRNTIFLNINRAEKNRHLNNDWYHKKNRIIEIEMSSSQFSDAITSLNMGEGTPVTLKYVDNEYMDDCPDISTREQFQNEFKEHVNDISKTLKNLKSNAKELLTKKTLLKVKEKEELLNIIERICMEVIENTPFIQKQFNIAIDETVKEAKGEVESFLTNIITNLGIESLNKNNILNIDGQPNLSIENNNTICCDEEKTDITSFKINEKE